MTNHGSITTLFLDIGGVLLTNGWDSAMRKQAADKFKFDFEEMNERHHLTFDTYEEGKLSLDEYLHRVLFYEERTYTPDDFKEYMFQQSQPFQEMIDLVYELKSQYKLQVAAVSNEGRELTKYRIDKFELGSFIDFFISSCFVHYRKPDSDIFRIALDIAQASPERVVYIEDRAMFVDVAEGLGIHGIVHAGRKETQKALIDYGLSID